MLSIAAQAAQAACAMVAQNISHLLWYKIATTKRTKAKRIVKPIPILSWGHIKSFDFSAEQAS